MKYYDIETQTRTESMINNEVYPQEWQSVVEEPVQATSEDVALEEFLFNEMPRIYNNVDGVTYDDAKLINNDTVEIYLDGKVVQEQYYRAVEIEK